MDAGTKSWPWSKKALRRLWGRARWAALVTAVTPLVLYIGLGGSLPFAGATREGTTSPGTADFRPFSSRGIQVATTASRVTAGEAAPGFSLQDLTGKPVNLSDFEGKTVVLNFWASWCDACRGEFPELQAAYESGRDTGLAVIGVNFEEDAKAARRFATDLGAEFPVVLDRDGRVAGLYGISGLPVTFIIGPDGILRGQITGRLDLETLLGRLVQAGFDAGALPKE